MNKYPSLFFNKIKNHFPIFLIIVSIILYNYFWDIIVAAKIFSFQASVFDLGVAYERLWIIFNHPTFILLLSNIQNSGIVILMSPLSTIHNPFFFVYLQTFWLSMSSIPLYFISKKVTNSNIISTFISTSFLLFFGIAGINWFDIHFQSLFIPLFITGYAFLIYGKNRLALTFLILSGLTRFPYIIFPLFLGFSFIVEKLYEKDFSIKKNNVYYSIFVISLMFTIIGFIHIGGVTSVISDAHGTTDYLKNLHSGLDNKVFTVFLLLAPFFMLPLLTKRWALLMVPFFFISFFSGYPDYYFPDGNTVQYYSAVVPFIYIGFIYGILKFKPYIDDTNKRFLKVRKYFTDRHKVVIAMFILIILLGVLYEPYGSLNDHTSSDFDLSGTLNYSHANYTEFQKIVKLIPTNEPYILYQDNMPEVNFRDPAAQTSYIFSIPSNYSYYINQHWTGKINYVLIDYSSYWFLNGAASNTIYSAFNHYISSGQYGIKAEDQGVILLEKGYSGATIIYSPVNYDINIHDIYNFQNGKLVNNSIQFQNLYNKSSQWNAGLSYLQPGNYNISITLNTTDNNASNYFNIGFNYLYENEYKSFFNPPNLNITGKDITQTNKIQTATIPVHIGIFMDSVSMDGFNYNWNGTLQIINIKITQTSP